MGERRLPFFNDGKLRAAFRFDKEICITIILDKNHDYLKIKICARNHIEQKQFA